MNRITRLVALVCTLFVISSCSIWHKGTEQLPYPGIAQKKDVKIRVADVSNKTGTVVAADMIGLFWDSLEDALEIRELLWTEESTAPPLEIDAEILEYTVGSAWLRTLVPFCGETELRVRCYLKDNGQVIDTVESERCVSYGDGPNIGAWRTIFELVAAEVVTELEKSIAGS